MRSRPVVGTLLFLSGASALVYQTVWLREFRLIFGSSTPATAAVLAIFMGGIGAGSAWLGARADTHPNPLRFYGRLELLIAASAAATPVLLGVVTRVYFASGGVATLGMLGATTLRLLLSALVLAVPTVLMGATLPAAVRSATEASDAGRRTVALLYGVNTAGAVFGAFVSTFVLLESLGNRRTLWLAAAVNVAAAVSALFLSTSWTQERAEAAEDSPRVVAATRPVWLVWAAAFTAGFVFFGMELVWYRLLTPLLGGTTFTFGLVLAVVLLGIGVGACSYAFLMPRRRVSLAVFALTCVLEALCLAIPFALGDRIAVLALFLRPLGALGFYGFVCGWAIIAFLVMFPAALIAGFQFPVLVSALGEGSTAVARHVSLCYASNTAGAIAGAIAGGFGLLPLLTATGAWRSGTATLLVLSMLILAGELARRTRLRAGILVTALSVALITVILLSFTGPTVAWRHSAIGAGRADGIIVGATPNRIRDWLQHRRRVVVKEYEGFETGVALSADDGYAFITGGKIDGHARLDAGTHVGLGLVGAALHPQPRSALVVGLGTGSTAGWLGAVPGIERVDVVEIEPAILDIARACAAVNRDVLKNPKVHTEIGDAREFLMTGRRRYDLVVSEPSNPYRAGVASLYTREFYDSVATRLAERGLFLQWVQLYEIDAGSLQTVYATLKSVFPNVETWQTQRADLLFVASMRPGNHDAGELRARLASYPYAEALEHAWRTDGVEGFLGHYVAGNRLAARFSDGAAINTDDRNQLEFGFARHLGRTQLLDTSALLAAARAAADDRPTVAGSVDWVRVAAERVTAAAASATPPAPMPGMTGEQLTLVRMHAAYLQGDHQSVLQAWGILQREPVNSLELLVLAEALAQNGDARAEPLAVRLQARHPIEAHAIMARLRWRQNRPADAFPHLRAALIGYRSDPWPLPTLMRHTLQLCLEVAGNDRKAAVELAEILRHRFAVAMLNEARQAAALGVSAASPQAPCESDTLSAVEAYEPHVPWNRDFLELRAVCYRRHGKGLAKRADADLAAHRAAEAMPLAELLQP